MAALDEIYAGINAKLLEQLEAYKAWLETDAIDGPALVAEAKKLGLVLDLAAGTIAYAADFKVPALPFELWYCRHGKTGGNTEPRVYQGHVDEPLNALNEIGRQQAVDAADKLEALGLKPDLVVMSPLSRASDTGQAFLDRTKDVAVEKWDSTAEMRFGGWDNKHVKDMAPESICHLFYLTQNAVVKSSETYTDAAGKVHTAENFVEVLTRMRGALDDVIERVKSLPPCAKKGADGEKKKHVVILYGHSMAGAALSILTANGKKVDGKSYLGFDGKYIMPNATPVSLYNPTTAAI